MKDNWSIDKDYVDWHSFYELNMSDWTWIDNDLDEHIRT